MLALRIKSKKIILSMKENIENLGNTGVISGSIAFRSKYPIEIFFYRFYINI